jgi:hypothetical protein
MEVKETNIREENILSNNESPNLQSLQSPRASNKSTNRINLK